MQATQKKFRMLSVQPDLRSSIDYWLSTYQHHCSIIIHFRGSTVIFYPQIYLQTLSPDVEIKVLSSGVEKNAFKYDRNPAFLFYYQEYSFTSFFVIFESVVMSVVWTIGQISNLHILLIFSHGAYFIIATSITCIF